MPPQNMLLWHKDYFELKALEKQKQQMHEGHSNLFFFFFILKTGDNTPK